MKRISLLLLVSFCFVGHSLAEYIELDKFVFSERSCELHNISSSVELTNILENLIADRNGFKYAYYSGYRYLTDFWELHCNNTRLEKLPSVLFEEFSHLITFHASNIELPEIIRDDFKFAGNIQELDLSKNNLTHLENKIFLHLQMLETIDLSSNQIASIHDAAFDEISKTILSIDLGFNKLDELSDNQINTLLKNPSSPLTLNLENNCISKFSRSNSSIFGKMKSLNLKNNKLKIFEANKLQIAELNLNNNFLETLTLPQKIEVLKIDGNKLKELLITSSMSNVSAVNNEIRALKCDKNLSIESLYLSGNEITSEVFVELKEADKMKVLDLSNTPLGTLKVDTFAEMKLLKELNLGNTRLVKISFGLFSHQRNLQVLNISQNHLGFIDYHMFTSLRNLRTWDISGNNLTKLKDFEFFRELFPNFTAIALDENSWSCEYLSTLILSLEKEEIKTFDPVRPVKNESSVHGIGCSVHELSASKNIIKEHFTATTKSSDKISFPEQKIADKVQKTDFTTLEIILIMIVSTLLLLSGFLSYPRIKKFLKPRILPMRESRQSSIHTITSFDNSIL